MIDLSQKSQAKPGGNTVNPWPKHQQYRWFLSVPVDETLNITASQLSQHLKSFCKKFTFQMEKGDETGYLHWQIELSLINKEYLDTVKNLIGDDRAHVEKTKNYFAAKNYCSKDATKVEGPYNENSVFVKTPKLKQQWQLKLKEILLNEDPSYRQLFWIYDKEGGAGKSDFCLHMYDLHQANLFNNGKFADIAYALNDNPKIVLFDLPRTLEERVNYTAIETIKTGYIFSGKYESKGKRFDKPHVVIMANFEPDYKSLSKGRWIIWTLENNEYRIQEK